jgi:hypothetical protein
MPGHMNVVSTVVSAKVMQVQHSHPQSKNSLVQFSFVNSLAGVPLHRFQVDRAVYDSEPCTGRSADMSWEYVAVVF